MNPRRATSFLGQFRTAAIGAACMMTMAVSGIAASSAAAAESVSENRPVDARVLKVSLGGVINLHIRQGATASLVVTGEKRDLDELRIRQDGDRLRIDMQNERRYSEDHHRRELTADLTLPNLTELESTGVGTADVNGFTGEELALHLDGAGAIRMTSRYRKLRADLTGVGALTLKPGELDRIDLDLSGAGMITVSGQTKVLHARLGGVGSLDARQLRADAVELDMTGLGSANVFARNAANLNLSGMGSATIAGKPGQRHVSNSGLGSVSWD